jgi:tetratricopeptide (TPR) repeat protein
MWNTEALAQRAESKVRVKAGDAQYNQLLRKASRETSQGQHAQAQMTYRRILALYPDDLTAARGYADVLMTLSQYDEAERFLSDLLSRTGHDEGVRRSLGEIHKHQGKHALFLEDVVAVLSNVKKGERMPLSWGLGAFDDLSAEPEVAARVEPAIRKLVSSSPDVPELRILLGDALMRQGDAKGALAEVTAADAQAKAEGGLLFMFADELYGAGRTDVASTAYSRAAELSTDTAFRTNAWTRVAEIALENNRLQDAAAAYRAIAGANPQTPDGVTALLALADIQARRLHDYPAALEAYRNLESHPHIGERRGLLFLQIADCQLRMSQFEEARKELEKLKATKADQETQAEGAFLAAEILFFTGDFTNAQTAYQDVAQNFTRTQKTNDAVGRYLQIVRAQNQGESEALKSYARMEQSTRVGDTTAVLTVARSIQTTYPATDFAAEALVREAEVIRARGESEAAIGLCERAVAEHPKARVAPTALAFMGDIYLNDLENKERALATYERLLAEYPENLLAAEVRRTVEKLRRNSES